MIPRTAHLVYAKKALDAFGTVDLVYIRPGAPSTDPLDETPPADVKTSTKGVVADFRAEEVDGRTVTERDRKVLIAKLQLDADAGTPFRPDDDHQVRIVATGETLSIRRVGSDPADSIWVLVAWAG